MRIGAVESRVLQRLKAGTLGCTKEAMFLTADTWEPTIRQAWQIVRERIEIKRDLEFAHEHTLQFHLAWEVGRVLGFPSTFDVRFEVRIQALPPRGVICTDIILWTDPDFKVALELKAPTKSAPNSPSAMTQGRMAFYKDIDRLYFLVSNPLEKVKRGMFLALANERGYVMLQRQHKNLGYDTFHGTTVPAGVLIPATEGRNGCPYVLQMPPHTITWTWLCERRDGKLYPSGNTKYFWLEPIPVLTAGAV